MKSEEISDELMEEIRADRFHAQILIRVPCAGKFEEERRIIESLGIRVLESDVRSLHRILLKLDRMDMRDAALKLSENGFVVIQGVNASAFDAGNERR